MQIRLWTPAAFTKKVNSTKRPSGGTVVEGYFRNEDPFSMFSPRVRIDFSHMPNQSSTTVPPYTYASIPAFGNRYYHIVDWVHVEGVWEASLIVDVLATYKDQIGSTSMYVTRASAASDGTIIDSKYPSKNAITTGITSPFNWSMKVPNYEPRLVVPWGTKIEDGMYVLALYGANELGLTYIGLAPDQFVSLAQKLMDFDITDSGLWHTATVELPEAYAKAVANPLQFIASVHWYPWKLEDVLGRNVTPIPRNLKLGYYTIPMVGWAPINAVANSPTLTASVGIPQHPQAATRGSYLGYAPYSTYHLRAIPLGDQDLPAQLLAGEQTLTMQMRVSIIDGSARLYLHAGTHDLGYLNGQVGVPVSLTQAVMDARGLVEGAFQAAKGVGKIAGGIASSFSKTPLSFAAQDFSKEGSTVHSLKASGGGTSFNPLAGLGQIVDGAAETVGGIADAYEAAQPNLSHSGSTGCFADWIFATNLPTLLATFYPIVDEDNDRWGRPLCQVRTPASLGGYILAEGAVIEGIATIAEKNQIEGFLNGGFFYE